MATVNSNNINNSSNNNVIIRNRNTGSSNAGDSDRIDVVTEPDSNLESNNNTESITIPINERKREKSRIPTRPYAAASNRIVTKGGRCNVEVGNIPNKEFHYIRDIGNTLLNTRWRWILISLCIANAIAYVTFAGMWMLVAVINDDHDNSPNRTIPCVANANSFTSYLLLSIETLSTIGYGTRYPNECHPSWMVITLQALTGVAIEGALVTAVFVKMAKPYNKHPMRLFSRKAVICMRDGVLCLIFRIRDIKGKHWAKTMIKAVLIKRRNTPEGEPLAHYFENLKLEKHGLLMWPQEIIHKITQDSPLWTLTPMNLCKSRFEIMVVLEGDSITTGQPSQSQTSFMNKEISWGYRFVPCVEYSKEHHQYVVDHEKFSQTVECDTPLCSAQELSGLLTEATKQDNMWDIEITSGYSTPISRRSESSLASKFSGYRMKKNEIDGMPTDRTSFQRQFSGAPLLETINSVENLIASNASLEETAAARTAEVRNNAGKKELLSTNL